MTETNTQSTNRRPRTRPTTYPEVLRAVADALSQPGADLPHVIVSYANTKRAGRLYPDDKSGLWAWTQALDDILGIDVRRGWSSDPDRCVVEVGVNGHLRGVDVSLRMAREFEGIEVESAPREITLDQLAALLGVDRRPVPAGSAVA